MNWPFTLCYENNAHFFPPPEGREQTFTYLVTPYLVVEVQAVEGPLREEFVRVYELLVQQLDLMAEDSASDPTNFQFLKLQ